MKRIEDSRILITGGAGFLGQRVKDRINREYSTNNAPEIVIPRSSDSDLRIYDNALRVTKDTDILINLAANVGGIGYNQKNPGMLFYDNIRIGANIIESARVNNVSKVIQIGTVCSYPKEPPVPFREENFWDGYPEETNAPYGIAKKAITVMGQSYSKQYGMNVINLIIVNLYGPGDHFDLENSHVIPAFIKKFVDAAKSKTESVTLWGTGNASREFLYVDDAAEAIVLAMAKYNKPDIVNIGSGSEITIRRLSEIVSKEAGYTGEILWDKSRPDGQPRRYLDISRARKEFGFEAKTDFNTGLKNTIEWYKQHVNAP